MSTKVNPEMLTLAREIRGMTQKELASRSGISQASISRYESELAMVSKIDLQRISEVLDFPVKFFLREGKVRGPDASALFHRKQRTISARDQKRIDGLLDLYRRKSKELLKAFDLESPFRIPYNIEIGDYDSIAEIALQVRSLWKMPSGPVKNLIQQLEDATCLIFVQDFGTDKMDEVTQWLEPDPPILLVNSRAPGDRLRFSLAHALGHLVLHHNRMIPDEKKAESDADEFAASFLMPADDILLELEPVTIENMLQLKTRWKVSMQALIRRALDLNVITERRYTSLFSQLSRAGYRKREPVTIPIERPKLIKDLLTEYQKQLKFTDGELAEMLDLNVRDFKQWYKDDPYLKIVERTDRFVG